MVLAFQESNSFLSSTSILPTTTRLHSSRNLPQRRISYFILFMTHEVIHKVRGRMLSIPTPIKNTHPKRLDRVWICISYASLFPFICKLGLIQWELHWIHRFQPLVSVRMHVEISIRYKQIMTAAADQRPKSILIYLTCWNRAVWHYCLDNCWNFNFGSNKLCWNFELIWSTGYCDCLCEYHLIGHWTFSTIPLFWTQCVNGSCLQVGRIWIQIKR